MPRGDLVHAGPTGIEIVPRSALDVAAGKPRRDFGPMPVAPHGVLVPQVLNEEKIFAERLDGFQVRSDLIIVAIADGSPIVGPHTVWHEHVGHAQWRFGEAASRRPAYRFEPWEGHGGASAA